jgi:signal transduction histidine kinase
MTTLAAESCVLLVNDSPDHLELLSFYLHKGGYRVVAVLDALDALHMTQREPFDLIVSDVMMPGLTGIEFCREVRADHRLDAVPILLVSALRKDSVTVIEGLGAGADDYLEMPCDPMLFIAKAARLIERAEVTKTLERLVEERTRRLEEMNRELECFSYSVSHDLRAPLAGIGSYLGAIERRLGNNGDEQSRELLSLARAQVQRALAQIAALLEHALLARTEAQQQDVDSRALVRKVIDDLNHETCGREITWKSGALPTVRADPAMLRLALSNLVDNALKYTRPREVAEIEIGANQCNGEMIFFVRDNGVGFDSGRSDKLFNVFQRLHGDDEFEGTGIGLANVRSIIERHKGRVWAEAVIGEGATFYFSLPHVPKAAAESGQAVEPSRKQITQSDSL